MSLTLTQSRGEGGTRDPAFCAWDSPRQDVVVESKEAQPE